MKPYQKIERELREAQIKGLETAHAILYEAVEKTGHSTASLAAMDEIERLIENLQEQQRGMKLM